MTSKEWIELAAALAWPIVAVGALIYVWRSDAIGKLIRISDAVKDLNEKLSELVVAEQSLRESVSSIIGLTSSINQIQDDLVSMKADVENIVDKSEPLSIHTIPLTANAATDAEQRRMFSEIDRAWQSLVETLQAQFGWFDARSVATAARGFARRNRSGPKLSYEQADEIARLQSLIKSYRRRQRDLESWLTLDVHNEYVASCRTLKEAIV